MRQKIKWSIVLITHNIFILKDHVTYLWVWLLSVNAPTMQRTAEFKELKNDSLSVQKVELSLIPNS